MFKLRMSSVLPSILLFVLASSLVFMSLAIGAVEVKESVHQGDSRQALKGFFLQSKQIKPLKRPFISAGSFVYFPNKGLLWHTQKPIDSITLFANKGVYKVDSKGVLQKEVQLDNDFFLALFSADEQKLAKFFTTEVIASNKENQAYCLALTPLSNMMKSLFKQINLCMAEKESTLKIPTQITLIEAKGNNTVIQLQLSSKEISPEELAYFE
ncbi:MAG: outer membrane lipoprotein carrier protein LolA [Colwellia sp.]